MHFNSFGNLLMFKWIFNKRCILCTSKCCQYHQGVISTITSDKSTWWLKSAFWYCSKNKLFRQYPHNNSQIQHCIVCSTHFQRSAISPLTIIADSENFNYFRVYTTAYQPKFLLFIFRLVIYKYWCCKVLFLFIIASFRGLKEILKG